jgi:predicted dehydrogenase
MKSYLPLNGGVLVCACHQNRFNKSVQKIREAMEAGRFGPSVFTVRLIFAGIGGPSYYQQASWRGTWERTGEL